MLCELNQVASLSWVEKKVGFQRRNHMSKIHTLITLITHFLLGQVFSIGLEVNANFTANDLDAVQYKYSSSELIVTILHL